MTEKIQGRETAAAVGQCGKNAPKTYYTHRVGTITCGLTFVLYGILFLLHMVMPTLDYREIFELWPVILILLGVEILASYTRKNQETQKFLYDFPAVGLVMAMTFFAVVMATLTEWWAAGYGW